MTSYLKVALMALVMTLPTMTAARAGLIRKQSAHSVKVTLDRLETILGKKGITVFARIDHAAGAMAAGQELAPTQVLVFGSPKMGTPLMTARREIGIDLPLKVLAWRDADGKVWLAYNDPADLKTRYRITTRDKVFAKMARVLDALSTAAVK